MILFSCYVSSIEVICSRCGNIVSDFMCCGLVGVVVSGLVVFLGVCCVCVRCLCC